MFVFDHANNADISMVSVVGWALLRRLWNRYPGDSFCGGNPIREGVFVIQLLDDAGLSRRLVRRNLDEGGSS